MEANTNILLESGTNELEIVVFRVDEIDGRGERLPCHFGVNVAKVREIIRLPQIFRVVNSHPAVVGMIKLRDKVITVVDLANVLNKNVEGLEANHVIVLEFNRLVIGVLVQSVARIYRISWEDVEPPSRLIDNMHVTGVVKQDGNIILVLDFEKIMAEICSQDILEVVPDEQLNCSGLPFDRTMKTVLVADDSPFIRHTIVASLRAAGYVVEEAENGEEAWNLIRGKLEQCAKDSSTIDRVLDLLITDIEMPKMDGLHLTTRIREEKGLDKMPIIIFSSLASEDNKRRWRDLGAQDILTKPDLPRLVSVVDALVEGSMAEGKTAA